MNCATQSAQGVAMSERLSLRLLNRQQAWAVIKAQVFPFLAQVLQGGHTYLLTLRTETRSEAQSRHFHSQIGQIAEHIGGDMKPPEDAKRYLVSAFRIGTIKDPELAGGGAKFVDIRQGKGMRGEVVFLGIQSRDFSVRLGSAFIEWLYALGA